VAGVAIDTGRTRHEVRQLVVHARRVARRAGPLASLVEANRLLGRRLRTGADAALAVHAAG
jgi:hypothetical protein